MKFWVMIAALVVVGAQCSRGQSPLTAAGNNLYDTGWTSGGSFISNSNTADGHYVLVSVTPGPVPPQITSFPATTYAVPNSTVTAASWVQANSASGSINGSGQTVGADWITFSNSTAIQANTPNTFDYRLVLSSLPAGRRITITGNFGGDDALSIYADGGSTALFTNPNWGTSAPGTLTFTSTGSDYLDFDVFNANNAGGYTGLFVNNLAGTMTAVPEPREWSFIVLLGMGCLIIARKLRRAMAKPVRGFCFAS